METIPDGIPDMEEESSISIELDNDPILFFYGGFGPSRITTYKAIQREVEAGKIAEESRENKRKPPKPPRGHSIRIGRTILGHGY